MNRFCIILTLVASIALSASCKRSEKMSDSELAALVLDAPAADAKVLLNKRVNLDEDPGLEIVAVISSQGKERFALLRHENDAWKRITHLDFPVQGSQPKAGVADNVGSAVLRVVTKPIGEGSKLNSVLVEYATGDPAAQGIPQILIFTKLKKSYDSLTALPKHPGMLKEKKIPFTFTDKDVLILFAENPEYAHELRYNGFEVMDWHPGYPFPQLVEYETKRNGNVVDVNVTLRNQGDYSSLCYISLSLPAGGQVEFQDKEGMKLYAPGQRVYNRELKGFIPASYPLFEITKTGWRPLHRTVLKFKYKLPEKSETPPAIFLRVSAKRGNDVENFPGEHSLVSTGKDQQGFPVYTLMMP